MKDEKSILFTLFEFHPLNGSPKQDLDVLAFLPCLKMSKIVLFWHRGSHSLYDYFSQTQIKKPLKAMLYSHRQLLFDLVDTVWINRDKTQHRHSAFTSPGGMPTQILSTAGFRFLL